MLSVNFKNVENKAEGIAVDEIFPGGGTASSLNAGTTSASADKIMIYTNDGNGGGDYSTYFLYKAAKSSAKDYWWVNSSGNLSGLKFKNGDSFWFYRRGNTSVTATVSGEVELTATTNVTLQTGYNMIGNYFPTGLVLNDSTYTASFWQTSGASAGATSASADKVMVYANNGSGGGDYVTYFLYKAAKSSSKDYNWVNSSGTVVNTSVADPGQGVWYYHRGTGMTLPLHMPASN